MNTNPHHSDTGRDPSDEDAQDAGPSKTQRKAAAHAAQELGAALVAAPRDQLARIEMPEALRDAVVAMHDMRTHEAKRRQLQYIGKLMRKLDETEHAAMAAHFAATRAQAAQATVILHRIEHWRDRLLAEPEAIGEFAAAWPGTDLQPLRTLIRNARREHEAGKPPKSARLLFQHLRAIIDP
jgi:ribosome-associated protein